MEEVKDSSVTTQNKSLMIFGRDVTKIPCFRSSWLYGICSGVGCGILTFMFTSKVPLASHVSLASTFGVSLVYFSVCRYQFAKDDMNAKRLRLLMKDSISLEGSDHENQIKEIEKLVGDKYK